MDKRAEKRVARVLVRALRTPATRGTQPSQITLKSAFLMIAFFLAAGFGLLNITAAPATAAPVSSPSEPSSPGLSFDDSSKSALKDDVTITATVVGSALAEAIANGVSKATGSSDAFAGAQVQAKAEYRKQGCIWSTGTNSYYSGGVLQVYFDSVPMKLCPLKHPVTAGGYTWHYIKVDGGRTGTNCGNYANPSQAPPPGVQTLLVLDVKVGTVAKIGVFSKVCVEVTVTVDVTLSYTYEGKTHIVHRSNTDSDSACKVKRDFAKHRVTKHTTRRASAQAVARAKARVETRATVAARTAAIAKAQAKAVRTVSVVIHIDRDNPPSLSATANGCVDQGQSNGIVSGTVNSPNDEAHPFTVSSPGKSPFSGTVGAQSSATYQLYNFAPGTYDVTATLTDINLSATVRVTVDPCPPKENRNPTGEIVQAPEHLYVANPNDPQSKTGEYRVKVVGSDTEDGGNVTLSVTLSGPVEFINDADHPDITDIEGTNKVRYFWIRAKNTPGAASITLVVTDSTGKSSPPMTKNFQVYADQF